MLRFNIPEKEQTNYNYEQIKNDSFITAESNFKSPEPLFIINDSYVLTRGNLSMIQGAEKSRKTFFLLILNKKILNQNPDMRICIFDTEQFKFHSALFTRRLREMTNKYNQVNLLNLRGYPKDVRFEFIKDHIERNKFDIVFIDNVRDCVKDYNSIEQSDEIITDLTNISENTRTHISVSLHLNFGTEKARGHLGSELRQKCETVFNVSTENDITEVKGVLTRNKPFDPFYFMIQDGLPTLTQQEESIINPF